MQFEGEEVDAFAGSMPLSRFPLEIPLLADEIVQMLVEVRVSEVTHRVDRRTGMLIRDHKLLVRSVVPVKDDEAQEG